MKNRQFETTLTKVRNRYNAILLKRSVLKCVLIILLVFNLYMTIRWFLKSPSEITLLAYTFRIVGLLLLAYVIYLDHKLRLNWLQATRWLDEMHGTKDDMYQNILELHSDKTVSESALYQKLYELGSERISSQKITYPQTVSPILKRITLIILISLAILWGINYKQVPRSLNEFWLNKIQTTDLINYIEVKPGNLTTGRNADVLIEVLNYLPDVRYTLFYKLENQWREAAMPDGKYLFEKLDYSFSYYVQAGSVKSNTFKIEVLDTPAVRRYSVSYHYPTYTKLKAELDSVSYGNISALKHTMVTLSIDTNIAIKEAKMNFSDGQSKILQPVSDKAFVTQLEVLEPLTWYLELTDALGRKNTPEEKVIDVIPDNPPEISIPEPGDDTILNQNMLLPLRILASDDFGLKNLLLKYQVNDQNLQTVEVKGIINAANLDLDYVLSFAEQNMLPGDVVTYWAEINDNSPEQQKAISRKYKARFPSIEEIYKEIEKQETAGKDELQDVLKDSKELQKEFEQKRRELLKQDNMSWEDKKQLENIVQSQEKLSEQVNKVADNYQELVDKLQNNQALSQETLEKMQKIQEILSEIDNDQLQKALEQMSNSLKNLDPEAIKKAMENFKFSLEDFNEKVEQTLKLLESIKKEQAVQKALQISEEMEKMQQALMDKTSDNKTQSDKLAEEQKKISDKLDAVKEQTDKIDEMLDANKDKEAKDMLEELQEMMEQDKLDQDMQSSEQSLKQNQRSQSKSAQQQAQQKMRKMSRKLKEMKDSMGAGNSQQIMQAMQTAVRELLIFSQKHEETALKYKQDPYPVLPELLADYEGMQLSINKLFTNPMVMMFVPPKFFMDSNDTAQNYRDFFINVNEIQYYNIPKNLEGIQKGLNLMAYDLIQAMNQSSQGGGSGGGMESLMKMLQQMGQEQMAMNMLTQQLMQQMQQNGGRMGVAEQQQLQRLASEQERLAENIRRALQNNPEAQKQGNSLKQMADEMEAISRQLKQNRIDQDLVNRQERILSKLLDAQKSINKREFSQKRKAETAEGNPENGDIPSTDFNLLRKRALLDEQYRAFPKEYQQVIQQYLKLLNEQNIKR
jgi:hypothetical protein